MNIKRMMMNAFIGVFISLLTTTAWAANKKIGVLVFDGVLTSDITAPIEVFGTASRQAWFSNYQTITINVASAKTVTTEEGLTLHVDRILSEAPDVDVLIVPSRYDMAPLIQNQALISYIRKIAKTADWVASNCSGAFLLAEAGVLDGKRATTWAGGEPELASAYPQVKVQSDVNYVIDGRVLTSNGSLVSYDAALALLGKMASTSQVDEVKAALQMSRVWKH